MPNIKSAKKRVLINQKKNDENRAARSRMNNAIKKFNNAIDTNNIEEAKVLLPLTVSVIDSSASKGIIHKNSAANKKSALSKRLSDIISGKLVISIKKDNKTVAAEKAKIAQEARDLAKVEYAKKSAEKKLIKIEAEKAKLEAEKAAKKAPAKAKKTDAKEDAPKAKKADAKEEAPKAKKADAKEEAPKAKKAPKAKTAEKE